jgi:hypothetical protein
LNYNITPNLKAGITVNTDFAEAEVDDRQVNLTRFPILLPERRDFFLQGANVFVFALRVTPTLISAEELDSKMVGPYP